MPDITMCCNYYCPLKKQCYRYRAVPDQYRQSFAMFRSHTVAKLSDPAKYETTCDHFWQVDEAHDKTLPTQIADNRYERDGKWAGLLDDKEEELRNLKMLVDNVFK